MIKNLSISKIFISFILLLTVVIVSNSCFALTVESADNLPFTVEDIYSNSNLKNKFLEWDINITKENSTLVICKNNGTYYAYIIYDQHDYFIFKQPHKAYFCLVKDNGYVDPYVVIFKNTNLNYLFDSIYKTYNAYYTYFFDISSLSTTTIYDCTNISFYENPEETTDVNHVNPGNLLYSPAKDTSFTYKLEGTKRGQCKLTIDGLDSSLRMYGYVNMESSPDCEILDTSANIDNLRLLATKTDNSDLYCYLYEGEELLYYIVDEDNKILSSGSINEMSQGNFLYGFNVNNGVDFVFLRDGVPYWDNTLTFKYHSNNSTVFINNDIVSMGNYSYIETNKMVASGTYTGYVYDSSNNLLVQADCNYSNNLSSLSIEVDTSYYETHTLLKHISCYWLQSIRLTGNNPDGSSIDFSNYKVQWSVPTWVTFESIELGFEEYNMRSGTLTGFISAGSLSMFNLQLYENLSDHTKNFDITLQVYDGSGNLVLTHIVNSDNIVDNQIKSEENNVDKGDYDIVDKPGYTGGSNSNYGDIGNIQNWTADDYINLMSTDNFVWEFFKAILGNLPWWITTPLTILIFGVVIITIIRFARGA